MVLDEFYVQRNPTAKAGEFVMISVSDTGTGMTEDVRDKAFGPFFTTKEVGEGGGQYLMGLTRGLLGKPYNDGELAFAIRRTMDGGHG